MEMKVTKAPPLEWMAPQRLDNLRAHDPLGHDCGYTVFGLRRSVNGRWVLNGEYSGQMLDFSTKTEALEWLEWLRNKPDYTPWRDWKMMAERRNEELRTGIGWFDPKPSMEILSENGGWQ